MPLFNKYAAYPKDNPNGYWFKRRPFGWGWVPAKWQGWAVLAVYLVLLFLFASRVGEGDSFAEVARSFLIPIALLTSILIAICYTTGERPKWSWGFPS